VEAQQRVGNTFLCYLAEVGEVAAADFASVVVTVYSHDFAEMICHWVCLHCILIGWKVVKLMEPLLKNLMLEVDHFA
jgi:hypothetical protein